MCHGNRKRTKLTALSLQRSAFQLERRGGVAPVDVLPRSVVDGQAVDDRNRFADVHRAFLGIEGCVGGKQHAARAEELEAADSCVVRAKERGIGVEHLEIVEWALL